MPGKNERVLAQEFYARDPRIVARELLGKILVRTLSSRAEPKRLSGRIVEVEAYLGEGDLAAHSAAGRTARNEVLFGPPGHAYVYFIYGAHYCLNFSCMPAGQAGGVLLRAIEPLEGIEHMAEARGIARGRLRAISGLTRARFNGQELYTRDSRLKIRDDGWRPAEIRETVRIGIRKSSEMPLRYLIPGSPFVSGKKY
jgi:DNA-3-methyladenine glycosylase